MDIDFKAQQLATADCFETIVGRVLTRQTIGRNGAIVLQYFVKTMQGAVLVEVPHQEHVCFCRTQDVERVLALPEVNGVRAQSLALQSFDLSPVSALYSRSLRQFRILQRASNDAGISLFEDDIKLENRFLIERFIAFDAEFYGAFNTHNIPGPDIAYSPDSMPIKVFQATRARQAGVDVHLQAISLDFECSPSGQLYSVGLYGVELGGHIYQKVIMVGEAQPCDATYIDWVENEAALISALILWFQQYDPDLIIGWAVVTFDLALLFRRAAHYQIPLAIGRNNALLSWKVADKFRPETLNLPGRVVLDGIDWLKAAYYQFERYSLEHVASVLLGEGKAINNVEHRVDEINQLFEYDKPALAHYNLTDSRLVWDIFEKTQLFDFAIERAKLTGLELGRVGASVAAFNNLYLPHLHRAGFVAPAQAASQGIESPGGYVMDSVPGLYRNILVFDFKSLYPSIIRTFLIDPKGLVQGLSGNDIDPVEGFLGAKFSREAPILPELIKRLAFQREQAKANFNEPLSQAIKIIMNSLYGVLGSRGCVFHDAKLASSITMRGHEIMKQTRQWIEEEGFEVIYGDTDSTFVWLGDEFPAVNVDDTGTQLSKKITDKWTAHVKRQWKLESYLELQYESHFEQFFMPTLRGSELGSKKRYVGMKKQPTDESELVFKGMEQVRSDWSPLARRVQYELYARLFKEQDVVAFLQAVVNSLRAGELDFELVFTKRLRRDIAQYTAKSTPHVKAAQKICDITGDSSFAKKGTLIEYVITLTGVEPAAFISSKIDYDYYIDRQLAPIADPVLAIFKTNFKRITQKQLSLL